MTEISDFVLSISLLLLEKSSFQKAEHTGKLEYSLMQHLCFYTHAVTITNG